MKGLLVLAVVYLTLSPVLSAGNIVVSNDEWVSYNATFSADNDAQFINDVVNFLGGTGSGNILLVEPGNGSIFQSDLQNNLQTLGYTLSDTNTLPASLSGYKEIFLTGQVTAPNAQLTNYVNSGGGVYIEAGTGCCGGPTGEASEWNAFLANFGLAFDGSSYNGVCCDVDVSAFQTQGPYGSSLFAGVNTIYMNNGNNVINLGTNPNAEVFTEPPGANFPGDGLYGAYSAASPVPEPSSLALLGSGLLGLTGILKRKLPR